MKIKRRIKMVILKKDFKNQLIPIEKKKGEK